MNHSCASTASIFERSAHLRGAFLALLLATTVVGAEPADEGPLRGPLGRDYWLAYPPGCDPATPLWLVVAVHGHNGTGAAHKDFRLSSPRKDYVVVAPTFPDSEKDGFYQVLEGKADVQLMDLVKSLRTRFKLRPKIFLYGFSGGSQFSHRFTMAHPELVIGCSSHSGGSWGPAINPAAAGIPCFFSCGLDDSKPSTPQSQPRIVEAEGYFTKLLKAGQTSRLRFWEGVGHKPSPGVAAGTAACFELATTGLFPAQREVVDAELARIDGLIAEGKAPEAKTALAALPKLRLPEPGPKKPTWASLSAEQRTAQRSDFVKEGIGGRSGLGRDLWVDDRQENEAGWNVSAAGRTALAVQRKAWLDEQVATRKAALGKR